MNEQHERKNLCSTNESKGYCMVAGLAPCMGEGGHVPIFQSCLAAFGNAGRKGRTAGSGGGAANTAHTHRVVVQMTLQLGQMEEFLY